MRCSGSPESIGKWSHAGTGGCSKLRAGYRRCSAAERGTDAIGRRHRFQATEWLDAGGGEPHRRLMGVVHAEKARIIGATPVIAECQRIRVRHLGPVAV